MSTLLIEGGHRLEGRVAVEGNKNAALPLLAACLLTEDECVLTNVPRIGDVEVMARLLLDLGAEVEGIGTTTLTSPRAGTIRTHAPDRALVGRLRGSVLLLGPLLARTGQAHIAPPGGDFPGAPHDLARTSTRCGAMGARQGDGPDHVLEAPDGLKGASMYLYEASVTGTETALLAAARADGRHRDPPRRDRAARRRAVRVPARRWAPACRASAARRIRIEGVPRLRGAAALAGRRLHRGRQLGGGRRDHRRRDGHRRRARARTSRWWRRCCERMNVECGMRDGVFAVKPSKPKAARRITTGLWPSFPSDLVSLVTVLATQAEGRTLVHDWMYELRLFALEQMSGMGADMFLADAHRIIVTGPTQLRGGRTLDSRDLRSGMSLIAAGLAAEGQTRVAPLETVERGYGQLVERLRALGAKVVKEE